MTERVCRSLLGKIRSSFVRLEPNKEGFQDGKNDVRDIVCRGLSYAGESALSFQFQQLDFSSQIAETSLLLGIEAFNELAYSDAFVSQLRTPFTVKVSSCQFF